MTDEPEKHEMWGSPKVVKATNTIVTLIIVGAIVAFIAFMAFALQMFANGGKT